MVTIDYVLNIGDNTDTTLTYQVPIFTQDNVLVVFLNTGTATTVSNITFNGVTIPLVLSYVPSGASLKNIYVMNNPPVGNYTFTITTSAANNLISVMVLGGVAKNTKDYGDFTTTAETASGTNVSGVVNAPEAYSLILSMGGDSGGAPTPYAEQTLVAYDQTKDTVIDFRYGTGPVVIGYNGPSGELTFVSIAFPAARAPSSWNPNVSLRNPLDVVGSANIGSIDLGAGPSNLSFGGLPETFWQNSFLHTVGRSLDLPPPSTVNTTPKWNTSSIIIEGIYIGSLEAHAASSHNITITTQNSLLLVGTGTNFTSLAPVVTFNNIALTSLVQALDRGPSGEYANFFIYPNPPVGNYTLTFADPGNSYGFFALVLTGASLVSTNYVTASFVNTDVNNGANNVTNDAFTPSSANSLMIDLIQTSNQTITTMPNAPQVPITVMDIAGGSNSFLGASMQFGSDPTNFSWLTAPGGTQSHVMIALPPAHAPSLWFPNITSRNILDVTNTAGLNTGINNTQINFYLNYGYHQDIFYKNSFLHTIGRTPIFPVSVTPPSGNLPANLNSYYAFDEGTGSSVYDKLNQWSSKWSGTLGNQYKTDGKTNSSGNLNGIDNCVFLFNSVYNISGFTVSLWFKNTAPIVNGLTNARLYSEGTQLGANPVFSIAFNANTTGQSNINVTGIDNSGNEFLNLQSGQNLDDGMWHNLVFVNNYGTATLYIDGLVDTVSNVYLEAVSLVQAAIGACWTNTTIQFYTGLIDNVGRWTRALDNAEVLQSFNLGKANPWPFVPNNNQIAFGTNGGIGEGYNPYSEGLNAKAQKSFQTSFLQTIGRLINYPIYPLALPETERATSNIIIDKVFQGQVVGTGLVAGVLNLQVSIPSQDAVLVVTGGSVIATGASFASVTLNGDSLVQLVQTSVAGIDAEIWWMPNPPVGTYTLTITGGNTTAEVYANAMVILGISKQDPNLIAASTTDAASTTSIFLPIQSDVPNALIIDAIATLDATTDPEPDESQNPIFNPQSINPFEYIVSTYKITNVSGDNMNYQLGAAVNASLVAVIFRPAHAASMWFPNVTLRSLDDVVDTNALDTELTPAFGSYGYKPSVFSKNSFVHTIGRFPVPAVISSGSSTLALATTLEEFAKNSTVALKTTLEVIPHYSTVACATKLETAAEYSTVACATKLETAAKYSTVACATKLETAGVKSTCALNTKLEVAGAKSTVALNTKLEVAGAKSTIALKTTLETIGIKSTIALKATLETIKQSSTVALKTTLETAGAKSTVALKTTLEIAGAKSALALNTKLEVAGAKSTLALNTKLEIVGAKSTCALNAKLETYYKYTTLACATKLETSAKHSTVACATELQSAAQNSTLAHATKLETAAKYSIVACATRLESAAQYSTVACATRLETSRVKSTLACKTTLEKYAQYSTLALATILETYEIKSSYALKFDGSQNYVSLGTMGNFGSNLGSGFYCSFQIKTTSAALGRFGNVDNVNFKGFMIGFNETAGGTGAVGKIRFRFGDNNGFNIDVGSSSTVNIYDGNVHTIVITWTAGNSNLNVTIDGSSVPLTTNAQIPVTFSNWTNNFLLGARNNQGTIGNFYACTLDNFQIGTSSSVLYGSYIGGRQTGTGTRLIDTSGSGNNGTLTGSPVPAWVNGISAPNTVALLTTLEVIPRYSTVACATKLEKPGYSTLACNTRLESHYTDSTLACNTRLEATKNNTLACNTKLEKYAQYSTLACNTRLETSGTKSTLAYNTKLEKYAQYSTIACNTKLEKYAQYSTVACNTKLEKFAQHSTIACLTTLEKFAQYSTVACFTTLSKPRSSTCAIKTFLEATKDNTLALMTSLEGLGVDSTCALITRLEATRKNTVACKTTLEVIPQYSTVACRTTLSKPGTSTLASKTMLEATKDSTLACLTTLEKPASSTLACATKLESSAKYSTCALKTTLETISLKSALACNTKLESSAKYLTLACGTKLEAPKSSTIALKTTLESSKKVSTLALATSLQGVNVSCLALFTDLSVLKNSTIAIYTILEKTTRSTVALNALLIPFLTPTLALATSLDYGNTSTLALATYFAHWVIRRPHRDREQEAISEPRRPTMGRSKF